MLKSLFSGVSGLQSHQIAMDVEANNIANVNTVGYKYSRANFSDLLAQTNQISTAPQGSLGGKNAVQIGLGATVSSITRIHSQGSIQNSDKNTDMAIEGGGYFIVSPDSGNTFKYTRSGDFNFDAAGNFVDNNGFTAQGWLRDETTGLVDASAPTQSIVIPPGLTTPAKITDLVTVKANLNSGPLITNMSTAYATDSAGVTIDAAGNAVLSGNMDVMFNENGQALALQTGQGIWASFVASELTAPGAVPATPVLPALPPELDITFTLDDGTTQQITATGLADDTTTSAQNAIIFAAAINAQASTTGVTADGTTGTLVLTNENSDGTASHNIRLTAVGAGDSSGLVNNTVETAWEYTYDPLSAVALADTNKTFTTMADLREALQVQAISDLDTGGASTPTVIINESGQFEFSNTGGEVPANLKITRNVKNTTENIRFTESMQSLNSTLPVGSTAKALSQGFNAASVANSINIYDSLGTKHTLRMEYRKTELDLTTGTTWNVTITVPEPGVIGTAAPLNQTTGSVRFNSDGSLFSPSSLDIVFTANNGSTPDQAIKIDLGTAGGYDGMTSYDDTSKTTNIEQNGYTGGDLVGMRIDQSGTIIGDFSNGRQFGLAQIAMANFANEEGLMADGGNIFLQSANSGEPIIGQAATGERGGIRSAALEASNVDLSRSLTQLIIIQRGYQANGKTITTSDQLLNTLINLKN